MTYSKVVTLADMATHITDGDHLPPPKSPTGVPFMSSPPLAYMFF
jgi:type I restriction enzyme S subunit